MGTNSAKPPGVSPAFLRDFEAFRSAVVKAQADLDEMFPPDMIQTWVAPVQATVDRLEPLMEGLTAAIDARVFIDLARHQQIVQDLVEELERQRHQRLHVALDVGQDHRERLHGTVEKLLDALIAIREDLTALRTEHQASAHVDPPPPATTADSTTPSPPLFPRQAQWLAHQMHQAGVLSANRLKVLGGPDDKTITKLLAGGGTDRDDVLHKIVLGLNEANRLARRKVTLTIADIPQD